MSRSTAKADILATWRLFGQKVRRATLELSHMLFDSNQEDLDAEGPAHQT